MYIKYSAIQYGMNMNYIARDTESQQGAIATSQNVSADKTMTPFDGMDVLNGTNSIPQTSLPTDIRPTSDAPEHSNRGMETYPGPANTSMDNHDSENLATEEDIKRHQETSNKSRIRSITPDFSAYTSLPRMARISTVMAEITELRQELAATSWDRCARRSDIALEMTYLKRELRDLTS